MHQLSSGASIQRCPHDPENPYAQISRALIRDKSLSPQCRWLIIYLLSMKDSWTIKVSQIVNHLKGVVGRDQVYDIFDEAIKAGYILKVENKTGLKRVKYYISETPKFKNILPLPENQDTGNQDTENQGTKERTSSSNEEKENHRKDSNPKVPLGKKKAVDKPPASADASALSQKLLFEVKKIDEHFKPKTFDDWPSAMQKILDARPFPEIEFVLENFHLLDSSYLINQCKHPKKLNNVFSDVLTAIKKTIDIKSRPSTPREKSRATDLSVVDYLQEMMQ